MLHACLVAVCCWGLPPPYFHHLLVTAPFTVLMYRPFRTRKRLLPRGRSTRPQAARQLQTVALKIMAGGVSTASLRSWHPRGQGPRQLERVQPLLQQASAMDGFGLAYQSFS